MAKLIVSLDGRVVGNYFLDQPSFSIGALSDNDLCLDATGVSRVHARIVSVGNDNILEDANSANGTLVNGHPIVTHILQHDDVIEIADYRIRYRSNAAVGGPSFDRTMVIRTAASEAGALAPQDAVGARVLATAHHARPRDGTERVGLLKALDGPHVGEEIELLGLLRTFGTAARQVAVINRRPMGYYITHVEGRKPARVNGKSIGFDSQPLHDNDVIEVGGKKLRFVLR